MIKKEIINLKELISKFGTIEQLKIYNIKKKIPTNTKKSILKMANVICINVIDLGRGKFEIEYEDDNIFFGKDFKFISENSVMKYLAPIIINKILSDFNKDEYITTKFNYARNVNMVNENYPIIKKCKTNSSKKLKIDILYIREFFKICDRLVVYYIEETLERLQNLMLLEYKPCDFIMYRQHDDSHDVSGIKYQYKENHKIATDAEIRYCLDIENKVFNSDDKYKAMSKSELYYRSDFPSKVSEELKNNIYKSEDNSKIIILLRYQGYKIFYTGIDRCKQFLKEHNCDCLNLNGLILKLTEELSKVLLKRTKNIEEFKILIDTTINQFKEPIEIDQTPIIKYKYNDLTGESNLDVYNEYNL